MFIHVTDFYNDESIQENGLNNYGISDFCKNDINDLLVKYIDNDSSLKKYEHVVESRYKACYFMICSDEEEEKLRVMGTYPEKSIYMIKDEKVDLLDKTKMYVADLQFLDQVCTNMYGYDNQCELTDEEKRTQITQYLDSFKAYDEYDSYEYAKPELIYIDEVPMDILIKIQ